ncbi:VWA domain-containing protein [Acidovorax sp. SRB_14]|uniref:nitric oxide reductase activation protein NorD n=1 Tax=Acidovorax sp. SRB_14 TaxID=1962699 RepID=UPI001563A073|nr:VWA domain-containing protein [Acidovorax sp. SRB_14]NMM80278.1 VWA domain-containing protein [Acidovorax sp. SRB_14]
MEEWMGQWWHRAVTRLAEPDRAAVQVTLEEMRRSLALLYRAGGGDAGVRVAPVADSRHGGPRGWLQRLAGSGIRVPLPVLDWETLALPAQLAVLDSRELNRDLYLWLAALAAVFEASGDWIADNRAATARALQRFAGLRSRHQRLLQAHLVQRPPLASLRADAVPFEAAVQAALRGEDHGPLFVTPAQVAPVWLWLDAGLSAPPAPGSAPGNGPENATRPDADAAAPERQRRRRSRRVEHEKVHNPLLVAAKVEAITTWSELVRLDRGTDDEADPNATAAANDMDTLSLARGEQTTASRIKFDLDLPSAAHDDLPLGPGRKTPEWDWRRRALLPDHCAVQCSVARPGAPYTPPPTLRATARRVRRRLEALRAAPRWQGGQMLGDEFDIDAWVRFRTEACSGARHSDAPPVYLRRQRSERSLATLLLADLSLSTDAYATDHARVIDVIRDALYVFGEALSATGDAFEMLGFSSVRRQHVRIQHLKGFGERWNDTVRSRVGAIKPGFYTRMGAALRDATRRLSARPERQRLLLVLTDGKPNDLDVYEGRYGLEDTRHAVQEAREAGLVPFCVTIDREAHDYLPMLFGSQGYALVRQPQDLVQRLTQAWATLAR